MLTNITNLDMNDKMSVNRYVEMFFKDKVYRGIKDEHLKRKVYRGKRDNDGHRNNEIYYVNEQQDFRINEKMLCYYVEEMVNQLPLIDVDISIQSNESKKQLFEIKHKHFIKQNHNAQEYKDFISQMLTEDDNQTYLNSYVKNKIKNRDFKDIIEKIEVYETGMVCILNNGFELSIKYQKKG